MTSKYRRSEAAPEGARLSTPGGPASRILTDANYDTLLKLEEFEAESGHTMIELAFSWLSSKPYVSSVIAGATRPEQVEQNAKAADWHLSPDEMVAVEQILQGDAA